MVVNSGLSVYVSGNQAFEGFLELPRQLREFQAFLEMPRQLGEFVANSGKKHNTKKLTFKPI